MHSFSLEHSDAQPNDKVLGFDIEHGVDAACRSDASSPFDDVDVSSSVHAVLLELREQSTLSAASTPLPAVANGCKLNVLSGVKQTNTRAGIPTPQPPHSTTEETSALGADLVHSGNAIRRPTTMEPVASGEKTPSPTKATPEPKPHALSESIGTPEGSPLGLPPFAASWKQRKPTIPGESIVSPIAEEADDLYCGGGRPRAA